MATYNGTNMVFDSEEEQVTYELNCLLNSAKDPQFKTYLESTFNEIKDYQNPMKLRDKIVENYSIYVQRMIQSGITVDTVYHHAVYGDMGDPEIKSPYSNINPYNNANPYSNSSNIIQHKPTSNSVLKALGYIGGLFAIYAVLYGVAIYLVFRMDFTDTATTALISIAYILIVGFSLYLGVCKLSLLLTDKRSLIIGFIATLIMAAIYFTLTDFSLVGTVAVCLGSFPPLYTRKKDLNL